jgi:hypothetical protein
MILPYDVEFPFILHSQEKVHFLVEIKNPGYIEIVVRKCDESNPSFSYTFDYDSFQKEDFVYSIELNDDPKYKSVQKVKPGTLYMQILNPPD